MARYHEPPGNMQNNEHNSTKMEQCGWCEYCSGSHRFQYCIEGNCSLMKSYSKKRRWDDKCFFKDASRADIQALIDNHGYSIRTAVTSIKRHRQYINVLNALKIKATERPPLTCDRKHDHFNIDNPIAVWFQDKNKWFFGTVKKGYRHHDGCVSYQLDGIGPQEGNDKEFPYKGGFWGNGVSVPISMLKSEYDFFESNLNEYEKWAKLAYDKDFNGKQLEVAPI